MARSGNEAAAFRKLRGLGLTSAQAAGAVGALTGESGRGLNPSARNPSSGAIGIGQWLGGRAAGVKPGDFQGQLNHLVGELKGSERGALAALRRAKGPREAAEIFTRSFERPSAGEIASSLPARQAAALDILRTHGGESGTGTPATAGTPGKLSITGNVTAAHEQPSREAAVEMVLRQGSHAGLPKLGHSRLAQANALFRQGTATETVPTSATQSIKATPGKPGTPAAPAAASGSGQFKITGANPERLKPAIVSFARKVAGAAGEALTGDSGATHSKYTVDGNVSDHFGGNATDIPATGARLLKLGRAALRAAGMPAAQANKAKGGLYNVGGHQVIFLTNQGGNHFNHLHISAK